MSADMIRLNPRRSELTSCFWNSSTTPSYGLVAEQVIQPAVLELAVQLRCPAMKLVASSVEAESVMVVQVVLLESHCHLEHPAVAAGTK